MPELRRRHARRACQKVAALALAAAAVAVTLVAVPLPASIPLIGDNVETAEAHPGYWRTDRARYERIPNGNELVSRCVQHDIDPATGSWICVRTQSFWEPQYTYRYVPPRTYWYHPWHVPCSKPVQVAWGAANFVGSVVGFISHPATKAVGGAAAASTAAQTANLAKYC